MIVCLDANIVIYHVERNPIWEPKVTARLKAAAAAGDSLAVSQAALLECLVGPLRSGYSGALLPNGGNRLAVAVNVGCDATCVSRHTTQMGAVLSCQKVDVAAGSGRGETRRSACPSAKCTAAAFARRPRSARQLRELI